MPRAVVLGGTGLVGRAVARRLLRAGWQVDLTGRDPTHLPDDVAAAGGRFVAAEREDTGRLRGVFGEGADLLVDCICYTAAAAEDLLPLARNAASTVMISSKAVYVDDLGNHSNSPALPNFPHPLRETQPTLAPRRDIPYASAEGYGPNKVAAEQVLLDSGLPVTILRPSKIHGEGAANPREWVFVKRVLDQRPVVMLAHRGAGGDHTTAAANIAALVETVATRPGCRILNSADPDALDGLAIARTVARYLGHHWYEVLLDDDADPRLGGHPWDRRPPVVLDTTAAVALGYEPAGDYASTAAEEIDWLVSAARAGDPARVLPAADDPSYVRYLDYTAEDAYLAATQG